MPSLNVNLKKPVIDLTRNIIHVTYTTSILNMNEHSKCEGQSRGQNNTFRVCILDEAFRVKQLFI